MLAVTRDNSTGYGASTSNNRHLLSNFWNAMKIYNIAIVKWGGDQENVPSYIGMGGDEMARSIYSNSGSDLSATRGNWTFKRCLESEKILGQIKGNEKESADMKFAKSRVSLHENNLRWACAPRQRSGRRILSITTWLSIIVGHYVSILSPMAIITDTLFELASLFCPR